MVPNRSIEACERDAMATIDLFNPTETHHALRDMVQKFGQAELEPQAAEHDEEETFNEPLFRRLGKELNLFGLTIPEEEGGAGLDALAVAIVCGCFTISPRTIGAAPSACQRSDARPSQARRSDADYIPAC